MKTIIALCLFAAAVHAQTFVKFPVISFVLTGSSYVGSASFNIPTNTTATLLNAQGSPNVTGIGLTIQEPGLQEVKIADASESENVPELGPATVTFFFTSAVPDADSASFLVRFDTVNTTPALSGFGVVPNGKTSTIALQSSTNLITWTSATNGTYAATNTAKFYRMALTVN
jgi:hypothetical protein